MKKCVFLHDKNIKTSVLHGLNGNKRNPSPFLGGGRGGFILFDYDLVCVALSMLDKLDEVESRTKVGWERETVAFEWSRVCYDARKSVDIDCDIGRCDAVGKLDSNGMSCKAIACEEANGAGGFSNKIVGELGFDNWGEDGLLCSTSFVFVVVRVGECLLVEIPLGIEVCHLKGSLTKADAVVVVVLALSIASVDVVGVADYTEDDIVGRTVGEVYLHLATTHWLAVVVLARLGGVAELCSHLGILWTELDGSRVCLAIYMDWDDVAA